MMWCVIEVGLAVWGYLGGLLSIWLIEKVVCL